MSGEDPKRLQVGKPLEVDKPGEPVPIAVSQKKGRRSRWREEGLDRVGITILSETERKQL